MDVEEELEIQPLQRIRTVVEIRDLLATANGSVRGQRRHRDVVASAILPVARAGPAVGRSRSLRVRLFDRARHVQRT